MDKCTGYTNPTGYMVLYRHSRHGLVTHGILCLECDNKATVWLTRVVCIPLSSDDRCTSGAGWKPLVCCYTLSRSSMWQHTSAHNTNLYWSMFKYFIGTHYSCYALICTKRVLPIWYLDVIARIFVLLTNDGHMNWPVQGFKEEL